MVWRSFFQLFVATIGVTTVVVTSMFVVDAQVMSSSNYQLQSDSVNVGGGYSSSSQYVQESTVGEIATGQSDSTSYSLRAGYQQMQEVYISVTTTGDVTMAPELGGLTGGTSNGSTTITVVTDSPSGYDLTIAAENDPAMQTGAGQTIANYDAGAEPDFTFTVNAGESLFGFSPSGVDVVQAFLDDGGACNTSSGNTDLACWDGVTTVDTQIASDGTANHPAGATTTVHFRVGIASGAGVAQGVYTATTTVTALPL